MNNLMLSMLNILKELRYYAGAEPKAWGKAETDALRAFQLDIRQGTVDTSGAAPVGRYAMDNVVFGQKVLRIEGGKYQLVDVDALKSAEPAGSSKVKVPAVAKLTQQAAVSADVVSAQVPSGPVISEPLTKGKDQ